MKIDIITFGNLTCRYCGHPDSRKIAYVLYPIENLDSWLEKAVDRYKTSIAVITGMDWDNDMTPWPAPGVPKGSPTFKGLAPQFLDELTGRIIPVIEKNIGIQGTAERTWWAYPYPVCSLYGNGPRTIISTISQSCRVHSGTRTLSPGSSANPLQLNPVDAI